MPVSLCRLYWKHCGGDQSPHLSQLIRLLLSSLLGAKQWTLLVSSEATLSQGNVDEAIVLYSLPKLSRTGIEGHNESADMLDGKPSSIASHVFRE